MDDAQRWKQVACPFHLHAPHSYAGCNFAFKENEAANRTHLQRVEAFRELLRPGAIIVHPGIVGSLDETLRQFKLFAQEFPDLFSLVAVENKPYMGLHDEVCLGASPQEIKRVLAETGLRFCLDFGHAICYAVSFKKDWKEVIGEFMKFKPSVFHISDGNAQSPKDQHLHLGKGNYDLCWLLSQVPQGAPLAIETQKDSKEDLDDFQGDVLHLKGCLI
jgi:endonuclease IV